MKVQLLFEKHLNRGRKKKSFFLLGLLFLLGKTVVAQDTFYGYLKKNTLIMGNNRIERTFLWNNGNLITHTRLIKQIGIPGGILHVLLIFN